MPVTSPTSALTEDLEENEYGPEDFGFIIGPDGSLKTLVVPENYMEDPPEAVIAILEIFGIDGIHGLDGNTLH